MADVELLARAIRGIEWIAAGEIHGAVGVEPSVVGHREVRFRVPALSPGLLDLGTVDDLFAVAGGADGIGHTRDQLPRIGDAAATTALERGLDGLRQLRSVPSRPEFDVTATFLGKRNFSRFEIEDAAGERIGAATGWRYRSRTRDKPPPTPLTVRVHLEGDRMTVGLRIGSTPLHRRPYRQRSRTASLRPPLARALALLGGLSAGTVVLDPFCGAGTVPIEAALAEPAVKAIGSDVDPAVLGSARANAAHAAVSCEFTVADAASLGLADGSVDCVTTNPPWGEAVRAHGSLAAAWREVRRVSRDHVRVVLVAPDEVIDEAQAVVGTETAFRDPIRLLGKHVKLAVLARDGEVTRPGTLHAATLACARARFSG